MVIFQRPLYPLSMHRIIEVLVDFRYKVIGIRLAKFRYEVIWYQGYMGISLENILLVSMPIILNVQAYRIKACLASKLLSSYLQKFISHIMTF